jgi:hypothetical protein
MQIGSFESQCIRRRLVHVSFRGFCTDPFQEAGSSVCQRVKQGLPCPSPALIVISTSRPPRRIRLPLSHKANRPTEKEDETKAKCCPVVDAEPEPQRKTRSRGRRKPVERPPPTFWRPSPGLKGKCQGYAYGYPSSFSAMEDWDSRGITYQRDKMRRIEACNVHPRALF